MARTRTLVEDGVDAELDADADRSLAASAFWSCLRNQHPNLVFPNLAFATGILEALVASRLFRRTLG